MPEVAWADNSRVYFEESSCYPAHSGTHADTRTANLMAAFPYAAEGTSCIVQKSLTADRTAMTASNLAMALAEDQGGFPAENGKED